VTVQQLFAVAVKMTADGARADLMGMASVLHRRGIDVLEAELTRPTCGLRMFTALFFSSPQQASTVLRTLESLVDVLDASLLEVSDARSNRELTVC